MDVLDPALSFRMVETATYKYFGEASPGADTSAGVWRVSRLTIADNTVLWAGGDADFNDVWDDHLTLSYS